MANESNNTLTPNGEPAYEIPDNPVYNPVIRKIQDRDPVHATTIVNPVIQQMIDNTQFVKNNVDNIINLIEKTYQELKDLKDSSKLIPGAQYLITDFVTKYRQPYTNVIKDTLIPFFDEYDGEFITTLSDKTIFTIDKHYNDGLLMGWNIYADDELLETKSTKQRAIKFLNKLIRRATEC